MLYPIYVLLGAPYTNPVMFNVPHVSWIISFLRPSKVFQGLLMVKAEHADTKDKFLRLWCHEESRVFRDRLISAEDRTWFNGALQVPISAAEVLFIVGTATNDQCVYARIIHCEQ